jgi:hypothetical protein
MDITPTSKEFQQAFKTVVELECTPRNVVAVACKYPALYKAVLEEQARLCGENSPQSRSPEARRT